MNSHKKDRKEKVPNSLDRTFDSSKRRFLKVAGMGLVAGLVSLTGLRALADEPKKDLAKSPDKPLIAQADAKKGPLLAQNEAGGKAVATVPKLAELEGIPLKELQDLAAKSGHAVIHDVVTERGHHLTYHVSIDGQLIAVGVSIWTDGKQKMVSFGMNGGIVGGASLNKLDQLCNESGQPFRFAKMFLDIYPSKDKKRGTMIDVYIVPVDSQHGQMVRGRPLEFVEFAVGTKETLGPGLYRID